jgi:hypothetical protein
MQINRSDGHDATGWLFQPKNKKVSKALRLLANDPSHPGFTPANSPT